MKKLKFSKGVFIQIEKWCHFPHCLLPVTNTAIWDVSIWTFYSYPMLPQTLILFLSLLFAIIRSIKRQFSTIVEQQPAPLLHSLGIRLPRPRLQFISTKLNCIANQVQRFHCFPPQPFFLWFHVNDHFHNRYGRFRSQVGNTVLLPWWNGTQ